MSIESCNQETENHLSSKCTKQRRSGVYQVPEGIRDIIATSSDANTSRHLTGSEEKPSSFTSGNINDAQTVRDNSTLHNSDDLDNRKYDKEETKKKPTSNPPASMTLDPGTPANFNTRKQSTPELRLRIMRKPSGQDNMGYEEEVDSLDHGQWGPEKVDSNTDSNKFSTKNVTPEGKGSVAITQSSPFIFSKPLVRGELVDPLGKADVDRDFQAEFTGTKANFTPADSKAELEVKVISSTDFNAMIEEESENKHTDTSALSETLSITYIIFLLVTGAALYLVDLEIGSINGLAQSFNVYLMIVQVVWLLVMIFNIRVSKVKLLKSQKEQQDKEDEPGSDKTEPTDGISAMGSRPGRDDLHGFLFGPDEISLFAKIGATVLGMGYLLHVGMRIAGHVYYLTADVVDRRCTSNIAIAMYSIQCLSIAYQIFFAVKFSNVIINKWFTFSKFGIVHCIATSLCFSVYTIIEEINFTLYIADEEANSTSTNLSIAMLNNSMEAPLNYISRTLLNTCYQATAISSVLKEIDPYFYPYCIQMNLIMVGFWILFWQNMGKTEKLATIVNGKLNIGGIVESRRILYADCHASNRGLFTGLLTVVSAIILIIIYVSITDTTGILALNMQGSWQLCVLSFMVLASCRAFYDIHLLDVRLGPVNHIGAMLQYACLPFVFLHSFFILVPYALGGSPLHIVVNVVCIVQVILQTLLITSVQSRCSNTADNRNRKPGRELMMFLLVSNISMWLIMASQVVCGDACQVLYDYYGMELWTIVSHATLPFTLFYRFHSSICFAGIWIKAYEPDLSYEVLLRS